MLLFAVVCLLSTHAFMLYCCACLFVGRQCPSGPARLSCNQERVIPLPQGRGGRAGSGRVARTWSPEGLLYHTTSYYIIMFLLDYIMLYYYTLHHTMSPPCHAHATGLRRRVRPNNGHPSGGLVRKSLDRDSRTEPLWEGRVMGFCGFPAF